MASDEEEEAAAGLSKSLEEEEAKELLLFFFDESPSLPSFLPSFLLLFSCHCSMQAWLARLIHEGTRV
jgi:hypothetical protein